MERPCPACLGCGAPRPLAGRRSVPGSVVLWEPCLVSLPFPEPTGPASPRAEAFLRYLDYFRSCLVSRLEGPPGPSLRASRLPAGWAPIELLEHLAYGEHGWTEWAYHGHRDIG